MNPAEKTRAYCAHALGPRTRNEPGRKDARLLRPFAPDRTARLPTECEGDFFIAARSSSQLLEQ